jgi:hypothetical protein
MFFLRVGCFEQADAFVGQAVNYQVAGIGLQNGGNGQQVFFAFNADIGFCFDRFFYGRPGGFIDGAGFIDYVYGASELVFERLPLDQAVEDFNVGFQMKGAKISDRNNAAVFFFFNEFAILGNDLDRGAVKRFAKSGLQFFTRFFWQKKGFYHTMMVLARGFNCLKGGNKIRI